MDNTADIDYLKQVYAKATASYKPRHLKTLLIGEAPPCNLDRFFYFEDVKVQDSLFLEIMGVLYPDQKQRYLKGGRRTEDKAELLELFAEDGYLLVDVYQTPITTLSDEEALVSVLARLPKLVDKQTPIILIKTNIYDLLYTALKEQGYNVINERLPFPGSGQQKVFREKFAAIVNR